MTASSLHRPPTTAAPTDHRGDARDRRTAARPGLALAIIVSIQLMIVLDATVVNVALPELKLALGFTTAGLSWVLNAYTLAFGGLLLLGARAGDILGRRPVLLVGMVVFTLASLVAGLAGNAEVLLVSRAVQGVGAAVAAPQVLALLTTMFAEGRERTRALGVFSAVSIGGSAIGLVVGGMLTQWASWRWVFFVNLPIGLVLLVLIPRYLADTERHSGRLDIAGALTGTLGMTGVVYGFVRAATHGWTDAQTVVAFLLGVGLVGLFVFVESRAAHPITPLRLFAHRNRAAAYVARLTLVAGMIGMFFFITQFMQVVMGMSALQTGLAFTPLSIALFLASLLSARVLVERLGAKAVMVGGIILSTTSMIWLTQISEQSSYAFLLAPLVLLGLGNGLAFVPLTVVALMGVEPEDAGAASGLVNVMQQMGGSLGLAILVTIFGNVTRDPAASQSARDTLASGISTAFIGSAVFAALTLVVIATVVRLPRPVRSGQATLQDTQDTVELDAHPVSASTVGA